MNMTTVPSNQLKAMQQEIADLKEQTKQLRINAAFNFEQYQDAGRLMFELKAVTEQQAEAIRLKDEALKHIASGVKANGCLTTINYCIDIADEALAIQPSPEILQARDERVAEAISTSMSTELDSEFFIEKICSGEWRKYL